ncbi:transporter [Streptomyces sp. TP-A0874]|uniref:transporter n=1 Tax=Streptomyces sp. TP-A0874 TaxID=549819 RepID=UPI0008530593|nr:transporter [Streptomyces sp. TP-A0874]
MKWALLRNGLHQSSGRKAVFITSVVLTTLYAIGQLIGLIALRGHQDAPALVVSVTGVVALGWAALPLFFTGGDETLDPTRLAMLPLRPRPLVRSLLVASLIGIGPLFTLTLAIGSAVAVARTPAAAGVSVLAVPLVLLVCLALARAVAAGNIRLLTSRRGRDLALLSGLFIAVGVQFVNLGIRQLSSPDGLAVLRPLADVLRWVPPASAIDAVRSAGEGAYPLAAGQLALSLVALLLLLWWWERSLTKLMTTPDGSTLQAAPERTAAKAGPAGLLPAGRVGTVMLRTLRYAWRDPKSRASWATSLTIGLLLPVISYVQGNPNVYMACGAAGLLGLQMYNQFGQDSSAFWMVAQTISSPRDAYLELRGRSLALILVALPYTAVVVLGSVALLDRWAVFPETMGLSLGLLGALVATGALASALFPYSIPQDSGYKNVAPGQGGLAWLSILGGMLGGAVLCAPLIALTIWLHQSGSEDLTWLLLPVGAVYGVVVWLIGLRVAAPRTAARLPEILTAVSKG